MFKHKTPLAVAMAAASLLAPAIAGADDGALITQIVDTFYKIYGTHPGFRVNHAKGVVAEGSFVATPAASTLSRATLFDGSKIPVTVRFSNDGGFPSVPDGAPGNPKGMAIKFHLPGGSEVDMVILAVKFFPVATAEEFRYAQIIMLNTREPLSQVALDCGWNDQAHFTRVFRRIVGITPSVWRRQCQFEPLVGATR
jgi:catalase